MFTRFERIHERDRHTVGQADRHPTTASAARMHSIAQQKLDFKWSEMHANLLAEPCAGAPYSAPQTPWI